MNDLALQSLIEKYLAEARVMQLATEHGGQPWICTLHFAVDSDSNIYWLSLPARRHSEEVADNGRAAIAIAVKTNMPIVGIQTEGTVELVTDSEVIKSVMDDYIPRHGTGKTFYDRVLRGIDQHKLYKFTPERFSLFDEVNFPGNSPQVWVLDNK